MFNYNMPTQTNAVETPTDEAEPSRRSATSFGEQISDVCQTLEKWRAKENAEWRPPPDEFPDFDWRSGLRGLVFLGLGGVVLLLQSWLKFVQGFGTLGLYAVLLAICEGAGLVLVFAAIGIFKVEFWRAASRIFKKTDNYPFTTLLRCVRTDGRAVALLTAYTDAILRATRDRMQNEESDLRERLTILGGSTPIPLILSLATGAWAGWRSFRDDKSSITIVLLAASVATIWLVAYSLKLRFALLELTRCRALLDFEIARRENEKMVHDN